MNRVHILQISAFIIIVIVIIVQFPDHLIVIIIMNNHRNGETECWNSTRVISAVSFIYVWNLQVVPANLKPPKSSAYDCLSDLLQWQLWWWLSPNLKSPESSWLKWSFAMTITMTIVFLFNFVDIFCHINQYLYLYFNLCLSQLPIFLSVF